MYDTLLYTQTQAQHNPKHELFLENRENVHTRLINPSTLENRDYQNAYHIVILITIIV